MAAAQVPWVAARSVAFSRSSLIPLLRHRQRCWRRVESILRTVRFCVGRHEFPLLLSDSSRSVGDRRSEPYARRDLSSAERRR
ncbi:hypothetical protein NL676_027607 [Syzygium grande]|nr:hypothetical protein NL676_027607 [Syzygium grande]